MYTYCGTKSNHIERLFAGVSFLLRIIIIVHGFLCRKRARHRANVKSQGSDIQIKTFSIGIRKFSIEISRFFFVLFQGYILGNPGTSGEFDKNARIPSAHGMALISDELYQVFNSSHHHLAALLPYKQRIFRDFEVKLITSTKE
ncbi:unnamed protein product [Linum tenue]|uniref:Uncharacterized protein n=1 Tax=Linum tenue TaxID=586396 RepID=A0AAV0PAJ4_9ROSI|nr:unnamed protein product [Linum tenue]